MAGEKEGIAGVSESYGMARCLHLPALTLKFSIPGHTAGHISLVVNDQYLMVGIRFLWVVAGTVSTVEIRTASSRLWKNRLFARIIASFLRA